MQKVVRGGAAGHLTVPWAGTPLVRLCTQPGNSSGGLMQKVDLDHPVHCLRIVVRRGWLVVCLVPSAATGNVCARAHVRGRQPTGRPT